MAVISEYKAKQALRCSAKDLTAWRKQGMPYVKQGRQFFYDLELVHRWFSGEDFPAYLAPPQAGGKAKPGLLPENWRGAL